jgi:hypothetical protein
MDTLHRDGILIRWGLKGHNYAETYWHKRPVCVTEHSKHCASYTGDDYCVTCRRASLKGLDLQRGK